MQKYIVWISGYFPKQRNGKRNVKVQLDLSNCATKEDLKNTLGVDASDFSKKTDLVNLKPDVDKSDTDQLKNMQSGLGSLKSKVDKLDIDK